MDSFCLDFEFIKGEKIDNLINKLNIISDDSFLF